MILAETAFIYFLCYFSGFSSFITVELSGMNLFFLSFFFFRDKEKKLILLLSH